tara:strand:- start:14 stop:397 length:384 start_codon:yes stop_codon:yes gene_type:complete
MALITITFSNPINTSVQANRNATTAEPKGADIAYFTPTTNVGGFDTATGLVEIGPITSINRGTNTITVFYSSSSNVPSSGDFIMFAKNRIVNAGSVLGYYAKLRVKNNSTKRAELYSLSVDVTESSK